MRSTTVFAPARAAVFANARCALLVAAFTSAVGARAADFHWAAPVSGSSGTAGNFVENAVPGTGDNVIIAAIGAPYSVDLGPTRSIASLVVASADATVLVQGSGINGDMTLTVAGVVDVRSGTVLLQSIDGGFVSSIAASSIIVGSAGTLRTGLGNGGIRSITGNVTNDGVMQLDADTSFNTLNGVYDNRGAMGTSAALTMVAQGQTLLLESGTLSLTGAGSVRVQSATVDFEGGTVVGVPRVHGGGALVLGDNATGSAAFVIGGGATLSGDVKAGQTVTIQGDTTNGDTTVIAASPISVAGSLVMTTRDGGFQCQLDLAGNQLSVATGGSLSVTAGNGGLRTVFGNVTNDGTVDVSLPLTFPTAGTTIINRGTWNTHAAVDVNAASGVINLEGGSFGVDAGVAFTTETTTWTMSGGTVTGRPTIRAGSVLVINAAATGAATFLMGGGAHLAGEIHALQDVLLQGNGATGDTNIVADADVVVDGLLTMRTADGAFQDNVDLNGHTLRITSTGRVSVENGNGGVRTILGDIVNDGTVDVSTSFALPKAGATYTNRGTWGATAATLISGGNETLLLQNGTFAVNANGAVDVVAGFVTMTGGTVVGQPVARAGTTLNIAAGAAGAASFLIGGPSHLAGTIHPAQSVLIQGNGITGDTTVVADSNLALQGTLTMRTADGGFQDRLDLNGHALNIAAGGHLSVEQGNGGIRAIFGNITNNGTVDIAALTSLSTANATYVNNGAWNVASTLTVDGGGETFRQQAGAVAATGAMLVANGAFTMTGGTVGTQPVIFNSTLTIDPAASGAASFLVGGSTPHLNATIHAGQTVLVQGNGATGDTTVTADADVLVDGTLIMRTADGGFQDNVALNGHTLRVHPSGHLSVENGNGGIRTILGSIDNQGTVDVTLGLALSSAGAVYRNSGTWNVLAPMTLSGAGNRFFLDGGVLNETVAAFMTGTAFDMTGGATSGTAAVLFNGALVIEVGATGGASYLLGGSTSLAGTIHSGQSVLIQGNGITGNTHVSASAPLVVAGTLTMRTADGGFQDDFDVNGNAVTIAPGGTLSVEQGNGGERIISGGFDNEGTVSVSTTLTLSAPASSYLNRGSFEVVGVVNVAGANSSFDLDGGSLDVAGGFTMTGGAFDMTGGAVTGLPLLINNILTIDPGAAGPAAFKIGGGTAELEGVVHPLQSVLVQGNGSTGNTIVTVANSLTVEGTVVMRSQDGGFQTDILVAPLAQFLVDIGGTLRSEAGNGGPRDVSGDVTNRGVIEADFPVVFNAGTLTNDVGGLLAGSSQLNLNGSFVDHGAFAPGTAASHGILSVTATTAPVPVSGIDVRLGGTSAGATFDVLSLNTSAFLSGTVVATMESGYLPSKGDVFTILNATSLSGAIASSPGLDLGHGLVLNVVQNASNVQLVADNIPFFDVAINGTVDRNAPFSITVTARDKDGNLDTAYTGAVNVTASDARATLPAAAVSFVAADAGVHTISGLVLASAGPQTIFVADSVIPSRHGSASVVVPGDTRITFGGFVEGQLSAVLLHPTFTVDSATVNPQITATLDGKGFLSGSPAGDGSHILDVTVIDATGTTTARGTFAVDTIAPRIHVFGVNDGAVYGPGVAASVAVEEAHLASLTVTLDGATYTDGAPINGAGAHVLAAHATDTAGHSDDISVSFTIDVGVPTIFVSGVVDGSTVTGVVTPVVTTDDPNATVSLTLDNAPYNGAPITGEGKHFLGITAENAAGGIAHLVISFTIDSTPPDVVVTGVVDGGLYASTVTPNVVIVSPDVASVSATLDGLDFALGTAVSAAGAHVLVLVIRDNAGNETRESIGFTIDPTAPSVTLSGVGDGDFVNHAVTLDAVLAGNVNGAVLAMTVDGAVFTPGSAVSGEGRHVGRAAAVRGAVEVAVAGVTFTIDTQAPLIDVNGVVDGAVLDGPLTVSFTATDAFLDVASATLDGAAFTSGDAVTSEGSHVLHVDARDLAGNTASSDVHFVFDNTAPAVTIASPPDGAVLSDAVVPAIDVVDDHPGSLVVDVDGVALAAGQAVTSDGLHLLHAKAVDLAGNTAEASSSFTLLGAVSTSLLVTRHGAPAPGDRVALYTLDGVPVARADGAGAVEGITSDTGAVSLASVARGRYRARIEHVWQRHFTEPFDVPAGTVLFDVPDEPAYDATLYVDPASDGGDGSIEAPFHALDDALALATFRTLVKVAGGDVSTSGVLPFGVSVRGGHRSSTWQFDPASQVTVLTTGATIVDECELLDVTVRGTGVEQRGNSLVRDVFVDGSNGDGITATDPDHALLANALVEGSGGDGVRIDGTVVSGETVDVENVTVAGSTGAGIVANEALRGARNISADNGTDAVSGLFAANIENDVLANGVVFASGPLHDRYLAQKRAGQASDSAGVDGATISADALDLRGRTTATTGIPDASAADFGYHAWPVVPTPAPAKPPKPAPPQGCGAVDGGSALAFAALFALLAALPRRRTRRGGFELAALVARGDVQHHARAQIRGAQARAGFEFAALVARDEVRPRGVPSAVARVGVACVACAVFSACSFHFDREKGVPPGTVVGRAVHEDGGGVGAFATITAEGANVVRRADGDGDFSVFGLGAGTWLLRVADDADGDGVPERVAVRAVSLKTFQAQLTSVLLGDVPLAGIVFVNGSVVRSDGAVPSGLARAFVLRSGSDLSPDELAGVPSGSLSDQDTGAEVDVGIAPGASGAFSLAGIAPGHFHVVAFDPGDGSHGAAISTSVSVTASAGEIADVGALTLTPVDGIRAVDISVASGSGVDGSTCVVTLVRSGGTRTDDVAATFPCTVSSSIHIDAPLGAFDVFVDGASPELHGVLLGRLSYPGTSNLVWGPLALSSGDPCNPVGDAVDRDGDGRISLPRQSDAPELWEQCAAQCNKSGADLATATCVVGNQSFDCDDDGDGEPDTLEPNCVSLCLGTDLDHDGVCDRSDDSVPTCPAGGCAVPDAGPADGGVDDAGEADAGVDAGPVRAGCSAPTIVDATGVATGTLVGGGPDDVDGCFDLGTPDAIFSLSTPGGLATLSASLAGSSFDTVLSVYAGACASQSALGCNDDTGGPQSLVVANDVPAGDVFFVVEGYRGAVGDYRLEVDGTYALGAACDPARTSLTCPGGACGPDGHGGFACLPPRDCAGDGIDADEDGTTDEDTCAAPPTVTCPANTATQVLSPAALHASAVDDVHVASRRWSLVAAPLGSTIALQGATTDDVAFTPLLAGDYRLRYVAADDAGQLSACEVTVSAQTDDVFRVELLWNVGVATGDPTDLDLHLLHPTAPDWFDPGLDCFFQNCLDNSLSWQFGAGPDPSPSLDLDARDGRGPENINIKAPEDVTYRIGAHYFADFGFGPSDAFVNVFCFGQLAAVVGPVTLSTNVDPEQNDFWEVADVTFSAGTCTVTPLESTPGVPLVVTTQAAKIAR